MGRPGARTRRSPVLPGRSSPPSAMLFLADPVRAATDHVLSRYGPRRADARSRACAGEKLLPAITSTGERFVESGNDHASDTEVLVVALLVILFEPSPYETQERAALARARSRAVQSGPAGRRRRRPPAPAAPGRLAVFSQRLRTRPNIPLTAAPHGVGCEVTRGDPGGGGGALSRRSSGVFPLLDRILGASTTSPPPSRPTYPFPLTARPPHPLQQVARARFARERPRLRWRPAAASRGEAVPPSRLTAGRPRHRLEGGRRAAPPSSLPPPLPPSP